jgi:hypothetical protein
MACVAPKRRAAASLAFDGSMAMMVFAPDNAAP